MQTRHLTYTVTHWRLFRMNESANQNNLTNGHKTIKSGLSYLKYSLVQFVLVRFMGVTKIPIIHIFVIFCM